MHFYEHRDKLVSIKGSEFIDQMRGYYLLKRILLCGVSCGVIMYLDIIYF
jgi:hypothetical protein